MTFTNPRVKSLSEIALRLHRVAERHDLGPGTVINQTDVSFMRIRAYDGGVDFLRPVETVIPGAQGKLLVVFVETTAELSIRAAARLSGVSPAQTSRIVPELAVLGILERNEVPQSTVHRLVEDNVATRALRQLARSRDLVHDELSVAARAMPILPISILVFGSLARGGATRRSDIDVVMVRPGGDASMANWSGGVEE